MDKEELKVIQEWLAQSKTVQAELTVTKVYEAELRLSRRNKTGEIEEIIIGLPIVHDFDRQFN